MSEASAPFSPRVSFSCEFCLAQSCWGDGRPPHGLVRGTSSLLRLRSLCPCVRQLAYFLLCWVAGMGKKFPQTSGTKPKHHPTIPARAVPTAHQSSSEMKMPRRKHVLVLTTYMYHIIPRDVFTFVLMRQKRCWSCTNGFEYAALIYSSIHVWQGPLPSSVVCPTKSTYSKATQEMAVFSRPPKGPGVRGINLSCVDHHGRVLGRPVETYRKQLLYTNHHASKESEDHGIHRMSSPPVVLENRKELLSCSVGDTGTKDRPVTLFRQGL